MLNLSGELRSAERGDDAVPTAVGKKEGQPAVFLPLWTPTFPLLPNLAQTRDRRPLRKEERQSGYRCVALSTFSQFTDRLLLHRRVTLRRRDMPVSRNSLVWRLQTAPAKINCAKHLNPQVPGGITRKKFGRHCYADLCVDLILCVAERYLTLRIG